MPSSRVWLLLWALCSWWQASANNSFHPFAEISKTQAYVTLCYGEEFMLGVRVLGQSLRESGTDRDMVVIVTGSFSDSAKRTLELDGWKVHVAQTVQNPNKRSDGKYPPRFWAVYTKLNVFNLTQYEKVIFLDADTIVVRNMDEVFQCPGFCAALRHSERFNSGVMAISPSKATFDDIIARIQSTGSYTGGDQGFLNAYYPAFVDSPLFDPGTEYNTTAPTSMLLPTRYNADIGLFVVNSNRWLLAGGPRVIHFTFGPFKPWKWWCGWLIQEQARWHKLRMQLGPDAHGRRYGMTRVEAFAQTWMPVAPPLVLALLARFMLRGWPSGLGAVAERVPFTLPQRMPAFGTVAIGYCSLLASAGLAYYLVPSGVAPRWGWVLMYEYSFCFFVLIFGKFLQAVWASSRATLGASHSKETRNLRQWLSTLSWFSIICGLLVLVPVAPTLLHVQAFALRIIVTVAVGLLANTIVTLCFLSLTDLWQHA